MQAIIPPVAMPSVNPKDDNRSGQPSDGEVEGVFRTVLSWIGEDPDREGLRETPARVVRALKEHFSGYQTDPDSILRKTFDETEGYDELVALRGVAFHSHCEHHMAPIVGRAWVAYVPRSRFVGISKLARVVEAYAKRLQIQERLTAQIANTIVLKHGADLVTSRMLGCFRDHAMTRQEFLSLVHAGPDHGVPAG
jgi:GTP cyclohydrolase I